MQTNMKPNNTSKSHWKRTKSEAARGVLVHESKKIFHVAILMPVYAELYKTVYDECKVQLLSSKEGDFVIQKFISHSVAPSSMDAAVESILDSPDKFDVIVSIGKSATKSARRITSVRKNRIPVVFTAVERSLVSEFVHSTNESRNNLIGVAVVTPCQFFPIKLIRKWNPEARTFIIPYREGVMSDGMLRNVEKIKTYFAKEGCTVTAFGFDSKRLPQELFNQIQRYDAVIIPEGGTTLKDRDTIIDFCKRFKKVVHADGREAARRGAVFVVTSD